MMITNGMASNYNGMLIESITRNARMLLSILSAIKATEERTTPHMLVPLPDPVRVCHRQSWQHDGNAAAQEGGGKGIQAQVWGTGPLGERCAGVTAQMVKALRPKQQMLGS